MVMTGPLTFAITPPFKQVEDLLPSPKPPPTASTTVTEWYSPYTCLSPHAGCASSSAAVALAYTRLVRLRSPMHAGLSHMMSHQSGPPPHHLPTCKHGQLVNVVEAPKSNATKRTKQIATKYLSTLVEEHLVTRRRPPELGPFCGVRQYC